MKDITEVCNKLIEIAGQERSALSIDTPAERVAAAEILDKNIKAFKERDADCCEIKFLKDARKIIRESACNNKALFVRPIFQNLHENICLPFCIASFGQGMLIPLEVGFVASFRVYFAGSGLFGHDYEDVAITKTEWEKITAPLIDAHKSINDNLISIIDPIDYEYMMAKSLGATIGIFEQVVGPKAGTDGDIGGQYGNDILYLSNIEGQQDCINEYLNTRQFLSALQASGLLDPFYIENDNHSAIIGKQRNDGGVVHKAVLVHGKSETKWVVDSWYHDNGEPAEVQELESWRQSHPDMSQKRYMLDEDVPYEYY